MPVEIQLTLKDYLRSYRAHTGSGYFFLPVLGSILIIVGIYLLVTGRMIAGGLVAIAFGTSCLVTMPIVLRRNFKANKKLAAPCNLTTSSEGIELTSEYGNSFTRWPAFVQFAETSDMFLLYLQPLLYHIFPKRFFLPEQLEEFGRLVRAHVTPKKSDARKIIRILVVWAVLLISIIVLYEVIKTSGQ